MVRRLNNMKYKTMNNKKKESEETGRTHLVPSVLNNRVKKENLYL